MKDIGARITFVASRQRNVCFTPHTAALFKENLERITEVVGLLQPFCLRIINQEINQLLPGWFRQPLPYI